MTVFHVIPVVPATAPSSWPCKVRRDSELMPDEVAALVFLRSPLPPCHASTSRHPVAGVVQR